MQKTILDCRTSSRDKSKSLMEQNNFLKYVWHHVWEFVWKFHIRRSWTSVIISDFFKSVIMSWTIAGFDFAQNNLSSPKWRIGILQREESLRYNRSALTNFPVLGNKWQLLGTKIPALSSIILISQQYISLFFALPFQSITLLIYVAEPWVRKAMFSFSNKNKYFIDTAEWNM